eukprot:EC688852.1.p3 GENE.EC688852.1~~EC688852.1.p3  ORF type:complete len:107 (+),score=34.55 EC688852.1:74-394(+)
MASPGTNMAVERSIKVTEQHSRFLEEQLEASREELDVAKSQLRRKKNDCRQHKDKILALRKQCFETEQERDAALQEAQRAQEAVLAADMRCSEHQRLAQEFANTVR